MISSIDNSRIKDARKLQQRRHRLAQQEFVVEGVRLLSDAWQTGVRPHLVFYDAGLAQTNPALAALLAELQHAGVECHECTPPVLASLCTTVTPQGIAALLPLPDLPPPFPLSLLLVLDRVRDPGNVGTLLRTAEATGVDLVICGPETVDPYNEKVVRAAMGAHFRLAIKACGSWREVAIFLPQHAPIYLADATAAMCYDQVDWRPPAVLVVGGEAEGASADARAVAQPIAIPMLGHAESLNAAIAGAVILFEAARQRRLG